MPDGRLGFYERVFNRLSHARQWSELKPQAITVAEVLAYCTLLNIRDVDMRDRLLTFVQRLDQTWKDAWAKKNADTSS